MKSQHHTAFNSSNDTTVLQESLNKMMNSKEVRSQIINRLENMLVRVV